LISEISLSSHALVFDYILQPDIKELTLPFVFPSTSNEDNKNTHYKEYNLNEYLLQYGVNIDNKQYPFSTDILLHLIALGWTRDDILIGLSFEK
jgi:hypothetical protein